jgi:hypothetical protein
MRYEDLHGVWRHGSRRIAVLAVVLMASAWFGATRASAATLTVCPSGCGYTQIAPAVAAAGSGDTVSVAAGSYHGGFTIDQNLTLNGAGAHKTVITGGGPVITVGIFGAATEPTVAIRGVTITGGVTGSSPVSTAYFGQGGVMALGGGIFVPPAANFATGATVMISDSVITGNTAAPTTSVDSGIPCPGSDGQCQFAQAGGAGIDNWGTLTVDHTTVSKNESAGPVTSDADGAGIYTQQGALTVSNSVVTGNRDIATVPDGRFAEGAGVMVDFSFSPPGATATLSLRNSVVSSNSASLTSNLPSFYGGALINMNANAGGIHVGTGIPTTVENTAITGNSATATDLHGEPDAIDAGMNVGDSPIVIQNTQIDGNQDTTTSATTADSLPAGDTLELDGSGTISNTSILDNNSVSVSAGGAAAAGGALGVFNGVGQLVTMQNSVISGNITEAFSTTGSATVLGGGVWNNGLLLMRNVQVSGNVGQARGPAGAAQGGGIWNGVDIAGPTVELTLVNTSVTRNVLQGSAGISLQGGGLFTTSPVTLTNTQIALNRPDQCVGCQGMEAAAGHRAHDDRGHRDLGDGF